MLVPAAILSTFIFLTVDAVCDGNPHQWNRTRRCDQYDAHCPSASWGSNCSLCDGIGGLSSSDKNSAFLPTTCTPVMSPDEMKIAGITPKLPLWEKTFVNTGFYEQQIFVKRDPFCLAQIPAMTSNGTHCFKNQEGTFNYDTSQNSLRIDYIQSKSIIPNVNMTEHFYHLKDGTVHPEISKFGILPTPVCPCISLGVGPVAYDWALDALFVGRERLGIEFLWTSKVVDHFVKGPHHVWTEVETGNIVRLYQPYNGLEVFDPTKYNTTMISLPVATFTLPEQCLIEQKLGCINGTL